MSISSVRSLVAALLLALVVLPAAASPDPELLADVVVADGAVRFEARAPWAAARLSIEGPDGLLLQRAFAPGQRIAFAPAELPVGYAAAGEYRYLLSYDADELAQTGTFAVDAAGAVMPTFAEDTIVQGSLCVGIDCATGESFGFDTIRLRENNLRLHFDDTSASAGFPDNDWRIVINDSSNGGANYFAIEDATAARQVFRVDAGAPANALYVDAQGDVGIGTANPVLELHVADGDTPTLRLEQDGSAGFGAQVWDIISNEANFGVRDVTNGSRISFKIKPGAPNDALFVASNGYLAFGHQSPQAKLDLRVADTVPALRIADTDSTHLMLDAKGRLGLGTETPGARLHLVDAAPTFVVDNTAGTDTVRTFALDASGNLTLGGVLIEASNAHLKENFEPVDGDDILARLAGLPLSTWNFIADGDDVRHLGPTAQDFRAAFGLGVDELHISPLDVGGVALTSIQVLHRTVQAQDARIEALEAQNAELTARMDALESLVEEMLDADRR